VLVWDPREEASLPIKGNPVPGDFECISESTPVPARSGKKARSYTHQKRQAKKILNQMV
jgi:hypothetical protein